MRKNRIMKYEGTRKAGASNQHTLYIFSVGKQELELLFKLLERLDALTPKMTENSQYKGRLTVLTKEFGKIYKQLKVVSN